MRTALRDTRRVVLASILALATCGSLTTVGLVAAPVAQAGSGNFCTSADLNPGKTCYGGEYHGHFYETEGWNSDGKGVGSCVGTDYEYVRGENCVNDGSGYDEVYCTSSCNGTIGYGFVEDNGPYNSVFTGWASWA